MSLVNEALKRAKEAHDKQAGTPLRGAPLHTIETPPASKMWIVALLCFVLALIGAGGGIWYWKKHQPQPPLQTKTESPAQPAAQPQPVAAKKSALKPSAAPIATATPPAVPKGESAPATAPAAEPAPKPESAAGAIVVDNRRVNIIPPTPAAIPAPTIPPPSPPVPLRLQGILYSASKPAAIINGRTVWVGDRISGMTISAIESDHITVIYSNQPIVIRMP